MFCCSFSIVPQAEHAKESPRGLDEVIVEASVVTAFTRV